MPAALKKLLAKRSSKKNDDSIKSSVENLDEKTADQVEKAPKTKRVFQLSRGWIITLVLVAILGLITAPLIILGLHTLTTARVLKSQADSAQLQAMAVADQIKAQNFPLAQAGLADVQKTVDAMEETYNNLAVYQRFPVAKNYYEDGLHLIEAAQIGVATAADGLNLITPHSELLGFAGEGSFAGGTAEERVRLILETLTEISPELGTLDENLQKIEAELAYVDPADYPEEFRGISVRPRIAELKAQLTSAQSLLAQFKPVIEQLPSVAGATDAGAKKYLVLFQNDNELRPSGGFLTAYAIIMIEDGKVIPEKSDDIYELDQKFRSRIPIPDALGRYLTTERYWNLRDMNTSPDFKVSMEQFYEHYQTVPGEPESIDGIIALDTHFLVKLMEILGPTEVPGYGTFSAENTPACDCPQIIYALSEIITRPTPYLRENRKGILGPLMSALLQKAYSSEDDVWPGLFAMGLESVEQRHIQFYFTDDENQRAAELAAAAGRLTPPSENTDFLAIINANLGGAKSNLFTEYEVTQVVSAPVDGRLEKTVEITYRNTRRADNCDLEAGLLCLNATLQDWTRLYVPLGSELISAEGLTEEAVVYEEEGFTVFDGFFTLEPEASAKLRYTYTVPYTDSETYAATFWKQGGIESYQLLTDVTGGEELLTVTGLSEYTTPF